MVSAAASVMQDGFGGRFGYAEEQGIQLPGKQIRREPAGDTSECGGYARYRVASGGCEDDAGQWYQHDIGRIGCQVTDHADERNGWGEQELWCLRDGSAHGGGE